MMSLSNAGAENSPPQPASSEAALQERNRQLTRLAQVAQQMHRHLEVPAVLRQLVETAVELTGAESGAAGLVQGGHMVFTEYCRRGQWIPVDYRFPPGYGVPGRVMELRRPVVSDDATRDPFVIAEIQKALGFTTLADLPLFSANGELLGCFEIHNKRNGQPFSQQDIEILQILANTAGIALDNSRLLASLRQTEAALRQRQHFLTESQRIARIGSWHVDLRNNRLSWTEETYRLYGVSPESFTLETTSFLRLIHPDHRADMERWIADFLAGKNPPPLDFRCVHPDGTEHWLNGRGELILDQAGQPVAMSGTVQDISERKAAQAALEESEERYRALFERSLECLFVCDFNGRFLDANPAALALLGYEREDIANLDFSHLLTADQLALAYRMIEEIKAQGYQSAPTVYRLRRKDGSRVLVETQVVLIYRHGRPYAILGLGRDITARHQAEQAEKQARRLLRIILDTVPVRVFWKDLNSRYLGCNLPFARDAGYQSPEELVGKTDYDMAWREEAPAYIADDREVMTTGVPKLGYEEPQTTPKGERIWLRTSKTPLVNVEGEIIGVLGTYEDITASKEMQAANAKLQERLLQAQKMESVGRLAGGIAHDFNNMLQAILGNVELALMDMEEKHPLREPLLEIRQSAERSAMLTSQLLAFARKQTISPRVMDINEDIGKLLRMLRRVIGEDIHLVWVPGNDIWPVYLDPGQLSQVLTNLVVNSRDAIGSRNDGKITIETQNVRLDDTYASTHAECVPGEYVMVAVSDNGCGMTDEVRGKLFEPFFTTKQMGQGTGLGLATVYGIVKQNGGLINAYSEPGKGATFKIYFPRAPRSVVEETAVPVVERLEGSETILLVEDEAAVLSLGRRLLEKRGYTVLTAGRPEEALALAAQHNGPIHLLITDVVMPGMNGRELRDQLRQIKPGLRCLFMSGYTANVIAHHGVLESGIEFLQKPFTSRSLAERVRQVLDAPG